MEQPQQLQNIQNDQDGVGGCNGGGKSSNYLCRQSSTRWTPTTDQIRILKELYYNNGVRSPNAEQIQRISARLRQYGKIEGKNVFYWFQNHKARERQKKRFTTPTTNADHHLQLHRGSNNCATAVGNGFWKADDPSNLQTKYPNTTPGLCASSSTPAGVVPLGPMVGSFGYGPMVTMENNFRDCSISTGGANTCNGVSFNSNLQYCGAGANTCHQCYTFFDDKISTEVPQEEDEGDGPELETLPLFPMHGEDNNPSNFSFMKSDVDNYYGGCYNGGSRACLELSLNSYGGNGQIFN